LDLAEARRQIVGGRVATWSRIAERSVSHAGEFRQLPSPLVLTTRLRRSDAAAISPFTIAAERPAVS